MMRPIPKCCSAMLIAAVLFVVQAPAVAAPIPSRADGSAEDVARDADLLTVKNVLARQDVARVLAEKGLSGSEIEDRLVRLSDQDLRDLASNLSHVEAAGEEVPKYIWWLAGGLLAVLILAAVL